MIRVHLKKRLHTSRGFQELDVQFEAAAHELVTIFGESGAGKTTILRMIAGLTEPDDGFVEVEDQVWFDKKRRINWPVQKRAVGFVFQEPNLFPNMTVEENLQFALSDKKDITLIDELLKTVHLNEFRARRVDHLSGGQKQRVALVRALVRKPKVFLLDEPLSSLDLELRLKLQDDIFEIYQRFKIPSIFVSHDLSEVFKLSSRILFLDNGRIEKSGSPAEVFGEQTVSGKFKFWGVVLDIVREDFIYIVTIQIGQNLTKVVATESEIKDLRVGEKVLVAAKAFNPIILKHSREVGK